MMRKRGKRRKRRRFNVASGECLSQYPTYQAFALAPDTEWRLLLRRPPRLHPLLRAPPPHTRGLHSSTFRLNVSAFSGIGGAFRGCIEGVWGG